MACQGKTFQLIWPRLCLGDREKKFFSIGTSSHCLNAYFLSIVAQLTPNYQTRLSVLARDKSSSLFGLCGETKFFNIYTNGQCLSFSFLTIVAKRNSNYQTWLLWLARDKRSSLFGLCGGDKKTKFFNIGTRTSAAASIYNDEASTFIKLLFVSDVEEPSLNRKYQTCL